MKRAYVLVPAALGLAAAAVVPVAVGASQPAAHAAKASVAVSAREFKFALRPTSATHGSVTFNVKNAGKIAHDFKIAGKKTPLVQPRKTARLTLNLKKGSYKYLCTVPGHAASGMQGTFRVR
jgi:uncharacterized cupredoxin-like copper-binding protein